MSKSTVYKYSALVTGVLFGLFLLLMASDSFETGISLHNIAGFFVHSIPAAVITGASVLGFFRPRPGSYTYLIIAITFTIYFHTYRNALNLILISFVPIVISILLFVDSIKGRKNHVTEDSGV
jgi:hypothetical protein